ncbi:MAG: SUMF1/EgtB/PvdO family nonheme iron enzyme [Thermoleophilaceae bacterium]|nr:SUMF1/EgtB/PvdO family nonheme iron enzyme [Thermoleophilaceae bacterium]
MAYEGGAGGGELQFRLRFLAGTFTSTVGTVPTAAKKLHALVVLALHAGRNVSKETLRHAMYDQNDLDWASDSAIQTPLARLRGDDGWPIARKQYCLEVDPDEVDILYFDKRARTLLVAAHEVQRLPEDEVRDLLDECRALEAIWIADPAEPFRDVERVASLFIEFRLRHERLLEKRDELEVEVTRRTAGSPASTPLLAAYLRDIQKRGITLAFGNPTSWTASELADDFVTLEDIWTPLRAADSQERSGNIGTHESMADLGTDLLELVEGSNEPLIVLGEPGAGKSTSVAMLAARAAGNGHDGLLPIWVNLGTVVPDPRDTPEENLLSGVPEVEAAKSRGGRHAQVDLLNILEGAIHDGRALLLLDGLDEVKEHNLDAVRQSVSGVLGIRNGCRVVVTCRSFDYRQSEPSRKVPIQRELELLPLSADEKDSYVSQWYAAAARAGGFRADLAQQLCEALQHELRNRPAISEMAELPLLLALLTLIHSKQELPDSRSVVCDQAIKFMLAETPPWREREPGSGSEASGPIVRLAVEVAFRSHAAEEGASSSNEGITRELVATEAGRIVGALERAGAGRSAPSPEKLATQFENSHGLLLQVGPDRFRFSHRYFQEYLAGQHYARGGGRDRRSAVDRGASVHWREPFRLMASFAGHNGDNLANILNLVEDLVASESTAASQLGAEMLAEISRQRLALWDFGYVLDVGLDPEDAGLWEDARGAMQQQVEDPEITLPERERAGEALAALGDQRFVTPEGEIRPPYVHLVHVQAGERQVGTTKLTEAETTGGFVGPPRTLETDGFEIGRYPVTNAEFRAFVEGDGYSNSDYWLAPRALRWVRGDSRTLDEIRGDWLKTVHEHHAKEIRDGEIDPARLQVEATRRTAPRQAPFYWDDSRFNRANQPVVGINFWEAEAFCRWATARGHQDGTLAKDRVAVLPSEFEWELAARPTDDDRIFPWGDDWDEERALVTTNTLNLRNPATVGIHLEPWPGGPADMAGNVWEWTATLFLPFDPEFDAKRLDADSLDERVVRGGSWYHFGPLSACSARAVDRSYNLFYDVGFRIAVVGRGARRAGCS